MQKNLCEALCHSYYTKDTKKTPKTQKQIFVKLCEKPLCYSLKNFYTKDTKKTRKIFVDTNYIKK